MLCTVSNMICIVSVCSCVCQTQNRGKMKYRTSRGKTSDISHTSNTTHLQSSPVPVSEAVIFARIALLLCAHVTHKHRQTAHRTYDQP